MVKLKHSVVEIKLLKLYIYIYIYISRIEASGTFLFLSEV